MRGVWGPDKHRRLFRIKYWRPDGKIHRGVVRVNFLRRFDHVAWRPHGQGTMFGVMGPNKHRRLLRMK